MFKRVVWMGMGAAAGSAATVWGQRKVKTQIDRVAERATPKYVVDTARARAVDVRDTVVAAVTEGRAAKQDAEAEMRQNMSARWGR
ncbi:MAG: hypothetical protein U0Q22_17665 [Acidimicrobiales bacterium]